MSLTKKWPSEIVLNEQILITQPQHNHK